MKVTDLEDLLGGVSPLWQLILVTQDLVEESSLVSLGIYVIDSLEVACLVVLACLVLVDVEHVRSVRGRDGSRGPGRRGSLSSLLRRPPNAQVPFKLLERLTIELSERFS